MAQYQTVVNPVNLVRGNAALYVAPYIDGEPSWVSVGAIKGLEITENLTIGTEENDNADKVDRISKQEISIKFTQLEILNLDVHEIMRLGLDTIYQESNTTKIISGSKSVIPQFMFRAVTLNDDADNFEVMVYRCQIQKGHSFKYQKDDADDRRLSNDIEIIGRTDAYRGGEVYEIVGPFNG